MIARIQEIWKCLWDQIPLPPYDETWKADDDWRRTYGGFQGVDYVRLSEYARSQYQDLVEANQSLETKSEWLFGLSLAALTGAYVKFSSVPFVFMLVVPSLAIFLLSAYLCMKARVRNTRPLPMHVRGMLQYEDQGVPSLPRLVASLHIATQGLSKVNRWKADHLRCAVAIILVGVALLILPAIALLWSESAARNTGHQLTIQRMDHHQRTVVPVKESGVSVNVAVDR